ncbi:ATP-binding cassette domain-containing protein [Rhodospirillaceae bacterium KN72]|uniref:ATP-binding cassette domain-containing protein n=1 Tax=Pacificispira spongiicola TaxID=2729598 RepID=A0A7Y0DYL3_9PROT|nr:ATP-binding cassette domain-containing protein [Pacificispira spongiicola]NMM43186.1 ATP-binding cassette domain-containing protein [Pacificispira spongiicola]
MIDESGLIIRDLSVSVSGARLFPPLSLHVRPGEVVAVTGRSGVGKSTLLSAICGTLDPCFDVSGDILVDGRVVRGVAAESRHVGILFQDDLLFPHMTVGDNLGFGLPPKLSRVERRTRIGDALAEAGLEGFESRDPATLSGGQRARIGCLRALLARPSVLLLDEPFSALDPESRSRFRQFVFQTTERRGLPVLLVTHDVGDVENLGDRSRVLSLDVLENGVSG